MSGTFLNVKNKKGFKGSDGSLRMPPCTATVYDPPPPFAEKMPVALFRSQTQPKTPPKSPNYPQPNQPKTNPTQKSPHNHFFIFGIITHFTPKKRLQSPFLAFICIIYYTYKKLPAVDVVKKILKWLHKWLHNWLYILYIYNQKNRKKKLDYIVDYIKIK